MIDKGPLTNGFIETFTGRLVDPAAPKIEDVCIVDVAHSLSMQCRYNGHSRFFYPVGQHCNILFDYARARGKPAATCLKALLHDSGETWVGDISTPLKHLAAGLVAAERGMQALTYRLVGLVEDEDDEFVHDIDTRILRDERMSVMGDSSNEWKSDGLEPLGVGRIGPAPADEVRRGFLQRSGGLFPRPKTRWLRGKFTLA
jgi:5'-nucleotidase